MANKKTNYKEKALTKFQFLVILFNKINGYEYIISDIIQEIEVMARYYTNGIKSGEIYIEEDIQFHQQWVLGDNFIVYTWFRPESNTQTGWRAQYSNKTIFKGNFSYKGDMFDGGTITEIALITSQLMKDGSTQEDGYGYTFEEELAYSTSTVYDDNSASGVSFSYSNDPTKEWSGGGSPKLEGFPISNNRSTLEQTYFGKFVTEGWGDNPFHLNSGITIAAVNDSYNPDSNGFSSVSGDVVKFSDHDSQYRFRNDLEIDNLVAKHSGDYDSDGVHEVYWKTSDGSAYLRSLMHADGNIRYANYQSEEQMSNYLTSNGYESVISDIV